VTVRLLIAFTAVAALLLAPGLISGPSLDPAVFMTLAKRLNAGQVLYVGAWDHKPPGVYLLYAAGQSALPGISAWHMTWAMSVLATAGTGATIVAALRRLDVGGWPTWLAGGAAVVLMSEYLMALGGGLTEPIAALPAAVGLTLATTGGDRLRRDVAAGFWLGAALIISLQLAVAVAAIALVVAVRRQPGVRLIRLAGFALGMCLPIAAVTLWLAGSGGLDAGIDAILRYAASYRTLEAPFGGELTRSIVSWTLLAWVFVLLPAAVGALHGVRQDGATRDLTLAACAWLVGSIVFFVIQGRFIAHYAIPLAVPLGLLAGLGLERLRHLLVSAPPRRRIVMLAPLGVTLVISAAAATAGGAIEWRSLDRDHQRSVMVAALVRARTDDIDTILVWGNQPRLYLDAERSPASAYAFLYPLTTPGYSSQAQILDVLGDLQSDPPGVVIDAGSPAPGEPGFLPLLIPRPVATDGRDLDLLQPLRDFIKQRYTQVAIVDGWVVYGDAEAWHP
jgi:4-amino-4-deoxy-L-arabinose transferase-like glycosyltransferase